MLIPLIPGFPGDQGIGKVPEEWAQVLPHEKRKARQCRS